jgi:DNA-binding PadR family transcriptional regulator
MRGQILKGHLDFLILASVEAQPVHGYAIIQALKSRSGGAFDLPEGTVYPVLHRLEQAGLLASQWSRHAGRRRCLYKLTPKGCRALAKHRQEWPAFLQAVTAALEPVS